ncbi:exodeoxyribonuclease VII small subunit [Pseudomonas aeruginosa]
MSRTTYEENMAFLVETNQRIERGEVKIEELEPLTAKVVEARENCTQRLDSIEAAIQRLIAPKAE